MFGKRPSAQRNNDDFESDEMAQDFGSESDTDGSSLESDQESWGEGTSEDDLDQPTNAVRKSSSTLSKILPFAAIGFLGAAGAGYYYMNYLAPKPELNTPEIVATVQEAAVSPVITAEAGPPVVTADSGNNAIPAMPSEASEAAAPPATTEPAEEQALGSISATDSPVITETEPMAAPPSNLVAGDPSLAPADPVSEPVVESSPAAEVSAPPAADVAVSAAAESMAPAQAPNTTMMAPTPEPTAEQAQPPQLAQQSPEVPPPPQNQVLSAAAPVEASPAEAGTPPMSSTDSMPAAETAPSSTSSAEASTSGLQSASASSDKIADMNQRLDVLEHQISDLTKAVDRLATASAPSETDLAAEIKELQSAVLSLKTAAATNATSRPAAPAVATRSAPRPATTSNATSRATTRTPASHTWVLRAAQDGEAWISATAQGQLRHVKVGENVNGLGRITSIQLRNGRWVVSGTQSSVTQ